MLKAHVIELLTPYVQELSPDVELGLEVPRHGGFGDYACNVAMQLAKPLGKSPREIAEQLREKFLTENLINDVEIAGPGFLNISLSDEYLVELFGDVTQFGPLPARGKKVLLEFLSMNVGKPMHIGHLRNVTVGVSTEHMLKFVGMQVETIDHTGDWGTQFGKLIVAVRTWGSREDVEADPMQEFVRLYIKFHEEAEKQPELLEDAREMNRLIEEGDEKARKEWKWIVETNWIYVKKVLEDLDISMDHHIGESFYLDRMQVIVEEMLQKKIATQNEDGSVAVVFEDHGIALPSCLIQKSDGVTLYHTRDLAALRYRIDTFSPDTILYVVGDEQTLHFRQLFAMADMLGWLEDVEVEHLAYGLFLSPDGTKFSTRKGKMVVAYDVLEEAKVRAKAILDEKQVELEGGEREQLIKELAYGAVFYTSLSQNKQTAVVLDWDTIVSFEGNSGPYLQYVHARCTSLLEKAGEQHGDGMPALDPTLSLQEKERELMVHLLRFQESVLVAAEGYRANLVAQYLHELGSTFNSFYAACPVLSEEDVGRRLLRLWLVRRTKEVMQQGLALLHVQAPNQM